MTAKNKHLSKQALDDSDEKGHDQHQHLTFLVGGEMFAIGILNIKEIIEFAGITSIPMMPRFIRGVINVRGAVVPVIDLSARFGRPATPETGRTCIVIVEVKTEIEGEHLVTDVGVVVDQVSEVVNILTQDIMPPPAFGAKIRTDFIDGMGKVNDKFVIILEVTKVLNAEEIAEISTITGASSKDLGGIEEAA
jgi:purine-binding chemotaxis protein CheW